MTRTKRNRAKAGGEIGMNGERYEGGQFLPSTILPKMPPKEKANKAAGKKQEIDPCIWKVPPTEKHRSIWGLIDGFATWTDDTRTQLKAGDSQQVYAYYGVSKKETQRLVDLWNDGERWVEV